MARPPKPINWDVVLKRMKAGNTAVQISNEHEIDLDTFYRRFKKEFGCSFGDYAGNSYEGGNGNILYNQYIKAVDEGDVRMLIHLGKVRLGQREPESLNTQAPLQSDIDKDHMIMRLQYKIAELEANADKSKTG
jgi:hypothetical protein